MRVVRRDPGDISCVALTLLWWSVTVSNSFAFFYVDLTRDVSDCLQVAFYVFPFCRSLCAWSFVSAGELLPLASTTGTAHLFLNNFFWHIWSGITCLKQDFMICFNYFCLFVLFYCYYDSFFFFWSTQIVMCFILIRIVYQRCI